MPKPPEHRARITWISPEEGGRTNLPTVARYSTVAKFPEDLSTWQREAWSVVIESDPPPAMQGNPSLGSVSFLAEEAPHERLRVGRAFELYEGGRCVAKVEVIE